MNPNELLAQQQALLNQMAQNNQQWALLFIVLQVVVSLVGFWVIYMFYARLRDIANELRKMRVTYEMEQERNARAVSRAAAAAQSAASATGATSVDEKYQPKRI